jgi:hypothetical protein
MPTDGLTRALRWVELGSDDLHFSEAQRLRHLLELAEEAI